MVFIFLTLLLLTFTLAPLSRSEIWWIRGWDFPRMQLFTAMVVLIVTEYFVLDLTLVRNLTTVGLGVMGAFYLGWWILPYTKFFKKEVRQSGITNPECTIKIMVANVLITNMDSDKLLELVREKKPDLMVTLESNQWWQKKLDTLEPEYPYTIKCPIENAYGMHVYSKFELLETKIRFLIEKDVPSMKAKVKLPCGEKVLIYFLHPAPPSPTENETSKERDAELLIIANEVKGKDEPMVVTGDMNDVAWSYTTRLFRKISGMLDPRVGRGMFSTFHAKYPFIRWPLDHLFHSPHFSLVHIERLPYFNSDHFPILIELELVNEAKNEQEGLEEKPGDEKVAREKIEQVK